MTARARLTAIRVVGFKSFAERTTVEFGPGISAIIGPNGSGKSNLADALRWTLGEAGRSLRTRRSEDVIFAGSSNRRATSMADVTLVLDNEDRLLPLEYGQVELGRRLFRSGENEYLLNRQRIRLRDLIELLDAGNLADNAFLFIGQGMVDQALALRPEERRPLFEEAAGVRRHERRRRQAEVELAEAEANLERLRDVLAELRPQARRLAAQADQLQARRSAGHELAEALVAAARGRWADAERTAVQRQRALDDARGAADAALGELREIEQTAERLNVTLARGADAERAQREVLDRQRARTQQLRFELARLAAEGEALARERRRIADERASIAARGTEARQELEAMSGTGTEDDPALAAEVDRLSAEMARLDADRRAGASARAAAERAQTARRDERDRARRRLAALATELAELDERVARLRQALEMAVAERDRGNRRVAAARVAAERAEEESAQARISLEQSVAAETVHRAAVAGARETVAALRARADALARELAALGDSELARAVRTRGGQLVAEGVEVEPRLRLALAAALGDAATALVVSPSVVADLPASRSTLVLDDAGRSPAATQVMPPAVERLVEAARQRGGGTMADALRRDPAGHVGGLVACSVWVETVADALAMRDRLLPGWQVVTVSGQSLTEQGVLRLAATDRFLQLRDERAATDATLAEAEAQLAAGQASLAAAAHSRSETEQAVRAAREARNAAANELRQAEEAERSAERRAETALGEQARLERRAGELAAERAAHEQTLASLAAGPGPSAASPSDAPGDAIERHAADLALRRDRLVLELEAGRAERRAAEERRRRAEIAIGLDEVRGRELDRQAEELAGREASVAAARERLASDLEAAERAERRAAAELEQSVSQASADRARLLDADRRAGTARDRLRAAETASRSAEVAALEARLQLEGQREALLVELAAIGTQALAALDGAPEDGPRAQDVSADGLAAALDAALERWQVEGAPPTAPPSGARISALRRRFHELGAGNPFAVEEHAEVSARLESLEAQQRDLQAAIQSTRQLIDDLNRLIADQFRATFTALEGAFARRFSQLFDGGEAQLSLTQPDDLPTTGVEITARPPGKKRQPLQMLSGGERALTAVALLLAMLEVRPVPFCVLDEVDAALDEANIYRFAQALRSLADKTQFIVITHNRGTVEAADALYGVTIGDDAASRIVSLRLPPATRNGNDQLAADEIPLEMAR